MNTKIIGGSGSTDNKNNSDLGNTSIEADETCYVIGIHGPYLGRRFLVKKDGTRIGRDRSLNDIILDHDHYTSRRHATIKFQDGHYIITDRRSRGRTFVDNNEVPEDDFLQLSDGSEIEIGKNIFRFVVGKNWDFSYPKKAGIFWVRHRLHLMLGTYIIIIAIAGIVSLLALRSFLIIKQKPSDIILANESVESIAERDKQVNSSLEKPLQAAPIIGDITGDGHLDVIIVKDNRLKALDGETGKVHWNRLIRNNNGIAPKFADLNNDGINDIISFGGKRVSFWDGPLGLEIKEKSPILQGTFETAPAVGDLDNDGLKDIVFTSKEGSIYIAYLSRVGKDRWEQVQISSSALGPPIISKDKTNNLSWIVVGDENGILWKINGRTPSLRFEVNTIDILEELRSLPVGSINFNSLRVPIVAGDVNGDGKNDFVALSRQNNVIVIDGDDHQYAIWEAEMSRRYLPENYPAPCMFDFDSDGLLDVAVASYSDSVVIFSGKGESRNAKILWSTKTNDSKNLTNLSLADFTKDGLPELLILSESGGMYIFNGISNASKKLLWKQTFSNLKSVYPPLVADINNNGQIDIIYSSINNPLFFPTQTKYFKSTIWWGTQYYQNSNNRLFDYNLSGKKYLIIISIACAIILIATILFFSMQHKRKMMTTI